MKHLTKLFKLVELTRSQPQYGYALRGIRQDDLSNLAEHQYLVTFFAWQLAQNLIENGAKINLQKILELSLAHDLGELFGGDISAPYAKVNPKAKKLAKAFEAENQKFFAKFFGASSAHFKKLGKEILDQNTDESLIVKVADYLECSHYLLYMDKFSPKELPFNISKLRGYAKKIKDKIVKKTLLDFLSVWEKDVFENSPRLFE
jgi:5'-deoxynucleotidase YfbR-like HD superfamily hydrolase